MCSRHQPTNGTDSTPEDETKYPCNYCGALAGEPCNYDCLSSEE